MFKTSKSAFALPAWRSIFLLLAILAATQPGWAATATLIRTDTTTSGSWKGIYGQEGAIVADNQTPGPLNQPILPAYATVNITGAGYFVWSNNGTPAPPTGQSMTAAPYKTGSATERIAGAWYRNDNPIKTFDIAVNMAAGQTRKIALYSLDWDQTRQQRIDVLDAANSAVLATTTVQNFRSGVYTVFDVNGSVIFRITGLNSGGSVISGIFFGADTTPTISVVSPSAGAQISGNVTLTAVINKPITVTSVQFKVDGTNANSPITTGPNYSTNWNSRNASNGQRTVTAVATDNNGQTYTSDPVVINVNNPDLGHSAQFIGTNVPTPNAGDWKNLYGQAGRWIPGDSGSAIPSFSTVTLAGKTGQPQLWAYVNHTNDGPALQWTGNPPASITAGGQTILNPARNPSVFYDDSGLTYDINFTDGKSHQVALYLVNFENFERASDISIVRADNNAPLDSRSTSLLIGQGRFYVWNISGHVKLQIDKKGSSSPNVTISGLFIAGDSGPVLDISMTSPTGGVVSGTIPVSASVTGGTGNTSVQFKVDTQNIGQPVTAAPYTIQWDSSSVGDGLHTLYAVATDSTGSATASVGVTVMGSLPTISMVSPAANATISGIHTILANAAATSGTVVSVQYQLDGNNLGPAITTAPYALPWDTTTTSNGPHSLTGVVTDSGGRTNTSTVQFTVQQLEPPVVTMTGPTTQSVSGTITLSATATSSQSTIQSVQFELVGIAPLNAAVPGPGPNFSTTFNVAGLPNATSFSFRAVATDQLGQTKASAPLTLTIDNPPPTVSFTPPSGALSGKVPLTANVTSPKGSVAMVKFKLDGVDLGSFVNTSGAVYMAEFDTGAIPNGTHALTVVATDVALQTTESATVTVSVANGPPVFTITNPTAGSTVAGAVTLQVNSVSSIGMQVGGFIVDGVRVGPDFFDIGPTYSYTWQSGQPGISNGTHTVQFIGADKQMQFAISDAVSFVVANTPPTVSMTGPANGSTQQGTVTLTATAASSTTTIASVQFLIDGNIVGTGVPGANNTYSFAWNSGSVGNSDHAITAIATDTGGLSTPSNAVTITVNNPPPTISILTPTGAFSVRNTVNITANAAAAAGIASIQIQLNGANFGDPLVGTGPNFQKSWNTLEYSNGDYTITAIAKDTQNRTTTSAPMLVKVENGVPPTPSAKFIKLDTTTKGNWKNVYGGDGFVIAGDTTSLPAYLTAIPQPPTSPTGGNLYQYTLQSFETRHLQKAASSDRVASTYYNWPSNVSTFTYDFDFTDGQIHRMALYALDQEGNTRNQTIAILNGNTNAVLNAQTLTTFNGGVYVAWDVQGHVKVQVTNNLTQLSAVISGIFFDTPPPPPTITLLPVPATTIGTIELSANATSAGSIKNVQFKVGSTNIGPPVTGTGPIYTTQWDSTTVLNGQRTISAVATDAIDQTATSASLTTTVNNPILPPQITWTSPAANAEVAGTIAVSATVSAPVGLTSFQFTLDGANLGPVQTGSGPFTYQWNTRTATPGPHTLGAKAKDTVNQDGNALNLTVTVNNPVPSASFIKTDTTTLGNWKGVYGTDGWIIPNDTTNPPSYATITLPTAIAPPYTWTTLAGSPNALQRGAQNATTRIASCFPSTSPFTFDINITDAKNHELALYMWDPDLVQTPRSQTIKIYNGETNALLVTQSFPNFRNGTYGVFKVTGHIIVRVEWTAGLNAVIGGLFLKTMPPPPAVSITTPTAPATLTGSVNLAANATVTAPATITSVQFMLDGSPITTPLTGSGPAFSTTWDSTGVLNGAHLLTAVATDSTGQTNTSAPVNVNTINDPGPPVISITSPGASTVTGIVTVSASARSPFGIASVQFKLDGANLDVAQTGAGPNYSIQWNTRTASKGFHTLTATAIDKQGVPLSKTSDSVQVKVENIVPSARFMKLDVTTKGDWKGVYGEDGYIIPNDSNTAPNYVTVTGPTNGTVFTYAASTSVNFLLKGSSTTARNTSVYYNQASFSWDMNFTDPYEHELAFYMWDADGNSRNQTFTILNGEDNTTLLTRQVSSFGNPAWVVFNVRGRIVIRVNNNGYPSSPNAVIYGLFFKTPPIPPDPPTVSIVSPGPGANLAGTVNLTANAVATSPATLKSVQFKVDGIAVGVPITTGGPIYTMPWDSRLSAPGQHTLTAIALDSYDQTQTSAGVSFNNVNPPGPPIISLTAPAPGDVIGTVDVTANAYSSTGIASVQFKLDGQNLGAPQNGTGPIYSVSLDTKTLTPVAHVLSAVATDNGTPATSSTSESVTIVPKNPTNSGKFIRTDRSTKGNWKGVYGADGQIMPGDTNLVPGYAAISGPGTSASTFIYPATSDVRALLKGSSPTARIASVLYTSSTTGHTFQFDMTFTDGQIHELAFYMWDLEAFNRQQTITILNADTNAVLATQLFNDFNGGIYGVFQVSGHVLVRLNFTGSQSNGVLNGLFFATPPPPPPAPSVSVVTPVSGGPALTGLATLTASATANAPATMKSVQFRLDGVAIGAALTGGPTYTMAWDSRGAANGSHTLTAVATDSFDQLTISAPVQISTDNPPGPPVVSMTAPNPGLVGGLVTVTANATSYKGIASVQFKLDGNNLGPLQTSGNGSSYSITWDTTGLTGSHFLTAVATDTNLPPLTNESTHLNVTVTNPEPTAKFIKIDTATKGSWKGVYGSEGYIIPNKPPASSFQSLPNYLTVTGPAPNGVAHAWPDTTWTDARATELPDSSARMSSVFYSATSFTIDLKFTDVNSHELALYMWDLDGSNGRAQNISILSGKTNAVLASRDMAAFSGGVWAVFETSGHVIVRVTRTAGSNAVIGGLFLKKLEPPPPPPPAPSITIVAPVSGTTVTGTTTLAATAVANSPATMASVQFRLDGDVITEPITGAGPSYSIPWNSATKLNGAHKLTAVAVDSFGQSSLSNEISITVSNIVGPPEVIITSPTAGPVSGMVTISANASSAAGIASVQFKVNGTNLGSPVVGSSPFSLQWDTSSLSGTYQITAIATDLQPVPMTGTAMVTVTATPPATSAFFVKRDLATKGDWKGKYGADGFIIANDSNVPPGYATVTFTGASQYTWNASTGSTNGLQKGSNTVNQRIASAYYASQSFTADVNMTDGQLHQLALYFWDADASGVRRQKVELLNSETGVVLATQELTSSFYTDSVYLVFNVRGKIRVRITNTGTGPNAILNGMFFRSFTGLTPPAVNITEPTGGFLPSTVTIKANATSDQGIASVQLRLNGQPLGAPLTGTGPTYSLKWATASVPDGTYTLSAVAMDNLGLTSTSPGYTVNISNGPPVAPAATFITKDAGVQPGNGDWVGRYGSEGYLIAAGAKDVPYYLNFSTNATQEWVYGGNPDTTQCCNKAGLQKSPTDLQHWVTKYDMGLNNFQALEFNLNFFDNQTHRTAIYLLDVHRELRREIIEILDANTGAVLDTRTLDPVSFHGTYMVYNLRGKVKVKITQLNTGSQLGAVASGLFFDPVQ